MKAKNNCHTAEENRVFRANLNDLLNEPGMSNVKIAEKCGVNPTYISAVKRGRAPANLKIAAGVAAIIGVPMEMLYKKTPSERKSEEWALYGSRLARKRKEKGLLAEQVAKKANLNPVVYEKIEAGQMGCSEETRARLDKFLGTSAALYEVSTVKPQKPDTPDVSVKEAPKTFASLNAADNAAEVPDIVLTHVIDLKVDKEEQRKVFRTLSEARVRLLESGLFGEEVQ